MCLSKPVRIVSTHCRAKKNLRFPFPGPAAPPRPPTHSSIPALLTALQNEWDALVLETFTLKQQYNSTRQELSYALYSQDAASRVIARLMRERDAAREYVFTVAFHLFSLTSSMFQSSCKRSGLYGNFCYP